MSSWGEKRDRRNEEWDKAFEAQQRGIQNARSYSGSRNTLTKKQTTMYCVGFMTIVIVLLTVLIIVIVD